LREPRSYKTTGESKKAGRGGTQVKLTKGRGVVKPLESMGIRCQVGKTKGLMKLDLLNAVIDACSNTKGCNCRYLTSENTTDVMLYVLKCKTRNLT
jgi:transcription elongation factor Elf1